MKANKGPFLRSKNKTDKMMGHLLIALLPIILFSFYKNGIIPYMHLKTTLLGMFYPLIFIFIGAATSVITELLYYKFIVKDKELIRFKKSYSMFPGLFLGLILPINTPILIVIMGAFFASFIGKLIFGGFGNNIFNPALIGNLFIIIAYGAVITSHGGYMNTYEIDAITKPTPLINVSMISEVPSYNECVKPYGSLTDFFVGTIPGAVGETSALICLISLVYLIITKTIKWRIPITYIGTVLLMTTLVSVFGNYGMWYPLFGVLSGGLLFGAVFMATDPVTSPTTKKGQVLHGISLGILTLLFRYFTSAPEGVLTSILTMNLLVFILDKIGSSFKKTLYYVVLTILIMLMIIISYKAANKFTSQTVDGNFNILERTKEGNKTNYVVTQKGNGGNIKAAITIENEKVTKLEILEHSETSSYYSILTKSNYLSKFINNNKVEDVDTVSGVTVSSIAIKKMVMNTLNDYKTGGSGNIDKEEDTYKVLNKTVENETTIYTVSEKSFGGNIKAEVTVVENKITNIKLLEYKDTCLYSIDHNSYYSCLSLIDELDYLNNVILNQSDIDKVDTVSGVTISSTALKNIVMKTLNYHGELYE